MLIDRAVGREHAAKPHAGADRKVELTAEVEIRSVRQAQSLGVTMIFQEVNLVPSRTAAQNVYLGRESRVRFAAVDRNGLRRLTERVLSIVGSRERPDALISDLSVAQQQLIEIAKALSFDAKILFMDEPTSSLSENLAQNLIKLICELRSRGMAIVFTTRPPVPRANVDGPSGGERPGAAQLAGREEQSPQAEIPLGLCPRRGKRSQRAFYDRESAGVTS